jgi:glycosyltransferase 2 family protein
MILLLLLKGIVAEMDLLLAVLLGRLVTVVGDLLFFVAASLIPAKLCAFEKKHA